MVGTCLPLMSAANGHLGKTLGSPVTATLVAFIIASVTSLAVLLSTKTALPTSIQIANTHWWMWIGGLIVTMNILTFTFIPGKIGIGNTIIFFVAGQLVASMIIEHFGLLNVARHSINLPRLAGVVMLLSGVYLMKKF